MMFWGVVFSIMSFLIPSPLELEAKDYADQGVVIEETKDEVARVVKLNNGIILRFDSKTNKLMEFDYEKEGLSYGKYTVGHSIHGFGDFDAVTNYNGRFYLHKRLNDNSMLRITVKDNIIIEITRFSHELTQA